MEPEPDWGVMATMTTTTHPLHMPGKASFRMVWSQQSIITIVLKIF